MFKETSTFERVFAALIVVSVAVRYVTGEWPVTVEVTEIDSETARNGGR